MESKVYSELTSEERERLDQKLINRRFSNLDEILEELQTEGFDLSRSGLGRYSKRLKDKTERIRRSQEYSKSIIEAIPDDEDHQSQALLALTKQTLFDLLLDLNIDIEKLDKDDVPKLIKSVASLSRSVAEIAKTSISVKKYKQQVKERCEEAAKNVGNALNKMGISEERTQFIMHEFLGIADE